MTLKTFVLTLVLLVVLAACADPSPALPTQLPVAELPTEPPPSPTSLPPTRDLSVPTPPSSGNGTAVASAVPPTPTRIPTALPTPVEPLINLSAPDNGAQLVLGSDIVVRGLAQVGASQTISVTLISANGRALSGAPGIVNSVGWEAGLTVPISSSGAATLRATILDDIGTVLAQDSANVTLVLDASDNDRYLALYNPVEGDTAVSGYFLFFDGRAQQPVNNSITISLWMDACQTQVAAFTFTMSSSGYWQGQLGVPGDVSGPGCAIASFGTPGTETWREVQIPVNVLAADSDEATGVTIISPAEGSVTLSGQELALTGTAFNAATVLVSVLMENGRIVSELSATPDNFGYWEMQVLLPFDVSGAAEITATAQDADGSTLAEARRLITINPGPTPTPQP